LIAGRASAGFRPQRSGGRFNPPAKPHVKGLVKAEINVTPLVDVVLVLLIIFMVVTPMIARGVDVQLPVTSHHAKKNDDNRDIVVSITREGTVYLGADRTPIDKLGDAVAQEKRRYPSKGVFLKADERLDYGQARRVMDAIHTAGVEDVQLGTDEAAAGAAPGAVR
jgi:biopolymer transport protein ExbD/biopolymer transport protein TolR